MGRIRTASLEDIKNAPLGPGTVLLNVADITPEGVLSIVRGTALPAAGRLIGGMTSAPTFNDSDEVQDLSENLVGLSASLKGSIRRQRTNVMVSCEIARLTIDNFKLIRPDFEESDWMSTGSTPEKVGTILKRRGFYRLTDYLDNVVMVVPRLDSPVGYMFVVYSAMNRSDDFEYQPDDEGQISAVSLELMAHADDSMIDLETGEQQIPYDIRVLDMPEEV